MSDWYSSTVGDIGSAFGATAPLYTPAVDQRAFNATPAVDERAFSSGVTGSSSFWRGIEDPMARFERQAAKELASFQSQPGTTPGGTGTTGRFDGDLSVLNQYDGAFTEAASKYNLDPNHIKAVAAVEGGWGESAVSGAGAIGLMQVMPGGYPELEAKYPNWRTNARDNVMLGAAILRAKIDENGGDVGLGTQRYLGVGTDPYTGVSTGDYWNDVQNYWNQLNQNGGSFSPGGSSGGVGADAAITNMFGQGAHVEDWGEFGVESGNGLYDYGTQYGLNGHQHTGVDVPMAVGSAYRAPMGGQVMCAGTGVGSGTDGGGCAVFNDYYGQGAGRVEVLLDNGVVLIYGHSSTSALRPGQRFDAGAVLGTSGGENSPHIHLEARVRDSSMPSGWRIVDPRTVLGGGGMPGGSGGGVSPAPQQNTGYDWFRMPLETILAGGRY